MEPPSGIIFDIQRWSTEDGPGIRTTIFFKGCPLRCAWCCNPEAWSMAPQLGVFPDRCQGCASCVSACTRGAARPTETDRDACEACGFCVEVCPHGARQLFGRHMGAEAILAEVARDRVFHRQSGGGVTFSGGEATLQPELLRNLTKRLSDSGVHLALETCGHFSWEDNAASLARMDLIYFDLKHMDGAVHERLTGVGNALILENAVRVAAAGTPMIVRLPLVPSLNDSPENLAGTARFVVERLGADVPIELRPYHVLGRSKHQALGRTSPLENLTPPSAETLAKARERLSAEGARVLG